MPTNTEFSAFFTEIGKLPLISEYADPVMPGTFINSVGKKVVGNYSEYRQKQMRFIDMFPVKFSVNLTDMYALLNNPNGFRKGMTMPVTVDFLKGMIEYHLKLVGVGICPDLSGFTKLAIRCWVNSETQSTDGIRHSYKENKIVEQFNNMLTTTNAMADYTKSLGIISDPSQGTISSPMAAALLDGRHLSLPMIWEKSTYEPQLDMTVRLISPYGNGDSFKKNIAEPLIRLTALTAPSSYDGVTSGMPSNMYIRAYGIAFIPLAVCDSFQVVRGGPTGRVNNLKQPLELSVSMSFKPAMPGFGAIIPPTETIWDKIQAVMGCVAGDGVDPMGSMKDVNTPYSPSEDFGDIAASILSGQGVTKKIPGITTLGTIIQSLRPIDPGNQTIPPSLFNLPNPPTVEGRNFNNVQQNLQQNNAGLINNVAEMLNNAGVNIGNDELADMMGTI